MKLSKLQKQFLILGIEEYSGLWEAFGETTGFYKGASNNEIIEIAKKALLSLVKDNIIELHRCVEPEYDKNDEIIDRNDAEEVLSNLSFWDAPQKNSISIRLVATEKGEAIFFRK